MTKRATMIFAGMLVFMLLGSSLASAEEPAIEALLADSPLIVVATPVFDPALPPLGRCSEIVLVKYSVKFKLTRVLKTDGTLKVDDTILTRLAVYLERPEEDTFKLDPKKPMILFLRKTAYEKDSYENTSTWFGVMDHTTRRQMMLEMALKKEAQR